ncbi:hypothetical protein M413DRAFT_447815 [Hebeloma cylindrosporum]|uniref:ceramidase n=1 Tax=Hebeloma cylindrosporum TaxID=76867 RepID=A0A0C3C207_HEBCY|nr:hypothetical protein M413DRAFT_447815 [Hebeloma cylindrosporum h7]
MNRLSTNTNNDVMLSESSDSNTLSDDTSQAPSNSRVSTWGHSEPPPLYQVDLSLPPQSRYLQICNEYKAEMAELVGIYDNLLSLTPSPRFFAFVAKNILRKVHTEEEAHEIEGISMATEIPIHLVVAYNTFLDLFSGCMSGGAQVKAPGTRGTRMIHFRNLDWNMDLLRDMVIRVEYLLGGKVIARAVTYAGYVGVLTGVREGLSISLNYRMRIQSKSSTFSNRLHYLLLLLGRRPSIASQLRKILLSPGLPPTLVDLSHYFNRTKASSCYLTFCTPSSVLIIEKDLKSAATHTSDQFLAVTNHDVAMEAWTHEHWRHRVRELALPELGGGAREIMEESMERKECMCDLWRNQSSDNVSIEDVKSWLRKYPIRNECTHFSCIMDPSMQGGGLVWVETCVE